VRRPGSLFFVAFVVGACGNANVATSYGSILLETRASDGDAEATFAGTATVVASTDVRIAVIPPDAIDQDKLSEFGAGRT